MPSTIGEKHGLVSVIIPVWGDYAKYLPECLESVNSQTYKNYEIIVVDTETDLPTARNVGIKRAKGEWILILDVDNQLTPEYLEKTVGKGDIVATYNQYFGEETGSFNTIEPTLEDMKTGNKVDANALYRKKGWEDVGGYDESMKQGWEDYDFWVRCLSKGYKITVVPELLLLYRKQSNSMSVTAGQYASELYNYIFKK